MTKRDKTVKASQHENYVTFTIISLLLPIIGIVLGVVYLTKDKRLEKKLGEHCLAFGVLSILLWSVVLAAMGSLGTTSITTTPDITSYGEEILDSQPSEDVIKITNTSVKNDGYGIYEVVGEATNNDTVARSIFLKATFYNSKGKIIGTADGSVDNLAPKKTKTFNLTSLDNISGYSKYKVQVETIY